MPGGFALAEEVELKDMFESASDSFTTDPKKLYPQLQISPETIKKSEMANKLYYDRYQNFTTNEDQNFLHTDGRSKRPYPSHLNPFFKNYDFLRKDG